jgi:hypothetical protein
VLATYGVGDHYTPEPTLQAFSIAGGFPLVRPVLVDYGAAPLDAPVMGNVTIGTSTLTFAMRQYMPPVGVDGHFVALQSTDGRADVTAFLSAVFAGTTPPVGH